MLLALRTLLLATLVSIALAPRPSAAFSIITPDAGFGVRQTLEQTARWDANPLAAATLADGIQVALEPGFVANLGVTDPALAALVEDGIRASFAEWENGGLTFDLSFGGPVVEGTGLGFEMDLFTVPGGDDRLCGSIAGCTYWEVDWSSTRQLTNGESEPGYAIVGVDIYFDRRTFGTLFSISDPLATLAILQRTIIHEVGHGIGLHHPTDPGAINFDTDFDPTNEMPVDPLDPAAGFLVSPFVDCLSIMTPNSGICDASAILQTTLLPDDRGGRDVLYPVVPEPAPLALAVAAAAAILIAGALRDRLRPDPEPARPAAGVPW
jgi:hypothetical protein